MKTAAGVILSLALATSASATVYRGKVWSWAAPVTIAWREVMQPTAVPGLYQGVAQCRVIAVGTGWRARCIQRYPSVTTQFNPAGTFVSTQSNGCRAVGTGNPESGGLAGTYRCTNGDYGSFSLRRVR